MEHHVGIDVSLELDHPNAIYELRFVVPIPLRGAALAPSRRRRSPAGN